MASRKRTGMPFRIRTFFGLSVSESKHRERAAQRGVLVQFFITASRTQAVGILLQAGCHADAGPAADAGEHADILLALVFRGEHVADAPGRSLELPELVALVVHRLEVAFQGSVEDHVTGRS